MVEGVPRVAVGTELSGIGARCRAAQPRSAATPGPAPPAASTTGEGDYLNCPMTQDEYERVLRRAGRRGIRDGPRLRQGEVLRGLPADRGDGASRARHAAVRADEAGRPVDPRTGRTPYAVVQLRQDNLAGDHFSLVGFQTQIKWGEQARVLRMIPGPRACGVRALRHGAPQHLHQRARRCCARRGRRARGPTCSSPARSPASRATSSRRRPGLIAGRNAAALVRGEEPRVPPRDDGDRRAGLLRLARRPAALSADQHHVRHHAAARRQAGAAGKPTAA